MNQFFKYPHTPHLQWLGPIPPRDDKVLSSREAQSLLGAEVLVEEKVDGANLGISLASSGDIQFQNRGQYLEKPFRGQFKRLNDWLNDHLLADLDPTWIVFGEWCAARHSISYKALPDWFVMFDVYDRVHRKFWSTNRVSQLAEKLSICMVPILLRGRVDLNRLRSVLRSLPSSLGAPAMEGIVVRREEGEWLKAKAKLVSPEFSQQMGTHWRDRVLEWNQVVNIN